MSFLIDTHCHLHDPKLRPILEEVLFRADSANVKKMIAVGTTAESSAGVVEIADQHPNVYAAVGIHPTYCHEVVPGDWDRLVSQFEHPRVVALGETGLDLYWKDCPLDLQQISFAQHWEWSRRTELPVIIHMRSCTSEMLEALRSAAKLGPIRGVLHSFDETMQVAEELLKIGLYISFAGMVTYKKSDALRKVASQIPSDRLLVETDSPYLSPEPHRSKRPNEPCQVVHTARCIADARGISLSELAEQTSANAQRLFPKMAT